MPAARLSGSQPTEAPRARPSCRSATCKPDTWTRFSARTGPEKRPRRYWHADGLSQIKPVSDMNCNHGGPPLAVQATPTHAEQPQLPHQVACRRPHRSLQHRTGPTVRSISDHPSTSTLQTSQIDTSKSLERPAVVDSSTSTEMPPDQPRHSFRHPQRRAPHRGCAGAVPGRQGRTAASRCAQRWRRGSPPRWTRRQPARPRRVRRPAGRLGG